MRSRKRSVERLDEPIVEIHMVGGIHPDLPFSYYVELLRGIKEVRPEVHIQAFTCVEIAHLAGLCGESVGQTLDILREAGLDSMPGGGAEVFSSRIRERTCADKLPGQDWLEVAKTAHRQGFRTNATMLYGHIETYEERLEHLDALRRAQDETGGFLAFIPLAFHPKNTELAALSSTTGIDDLKNIAVARLLLDNFDHIKAYWVMIGPKLAQIALSFGADDLDGTVKEEVITHMAGAETDQAIGSETLIRLITEAGRIPVERTTLYEVIDVHSSSERANAMNDRIIDDVLEGSRLSDDQFLQLYSEADLHQLGYLAAEARKKKHPEKVVTYVIDRNVNYTDICISACKFCAFYKQPASGEGYLLSREELKKKIDETLALGGTQILLQGGLHPDLQLDYYEDLVSFIKSCGINVHGFSPPEIHHFSTISGLPVTEVLDRLIAAGLDSIPGGGAEILTDRVRQAGGAEKMQCRSVA